MKKLILLLVVVLLVFTSCNEGRTDVSKDASFTNYIVGFTSGTISRKENITVRFADNVNLPEEVDSDLISIAPPVEGSLVKNGQSLIFSPQNPLKSGTEYRFAIDLESITEVADGLEEFIFSVNTIPMDYEISIEGLRTTDIQNPKLLELSGTLIISDYTEKERAEKMLETSGREVEWNHRSATSHLFLIKNIERSDEGYDLTISSSGKAIGIDKAFEKKIAVPSVKDFTLTSSSVQETGTPYVSLLFSDPLQPNQDLNGLIQIQDEDNPRFVIDGNQVQVYLTRMQSGSKMLTVREGIKNVFRHPLKESIVKSLAFVPENPQIKLIGKGTILPSTDGLVLPFEAVNLKSVKVNVVKIFEQNIPQFFQVNEIGGKSQLARTGRNIMSKSVELTEYSNDLSNWNRFTLDLASLFNTERGAIYQVRLSFRPEDSVYPCEEVLKSEKETETNDSWSIFDGENFNSYYSYSYYPSGYEWSERDNPCHVSYYRDDQFVSRNLIASDIGLITKIGGDNSLNVYTTDMVSASPVQANIKVLDYQLQVLEEGSTDSEGIAAFNPIRRPFLVIAESNGQKSYLKLDDASSLTLSNFDVSGTRIQNGIKGYIYGDRGVWRPGNNIYLSFMLEDTDDQIPDNQPVIFELRDPNGNIKDHQVANSSVENLYSFPTKTNESDVTGNWKAIIMVGNSTFSKNIKVETIKPNRLRINLDFDFDKITFNHRAINPKMSVNWLTGIKGKNLKVETVLSYQPINTTFDGLNNFEFDLPEKQIDSDKKVIFKGNTDRNGNTSFVYTLPFMKNAGGAVIATFETKAFEPGGDFSISTKSVNYYPYPMFVGLQLPEGDTWGRLKQDVDHRVNIAVVDGEGNPVNNAKVHMKIYEVNWRWWWDESSDYSVNYIRSSNQDLVSNQTVNIINGEGFGTFKISDWGRYLMIVEDPVSGHASGQYFYMSWREGEQSSLGATFLTINSNKEKYEVGEDIELNIPGSAGAQALVSIENGSRVVEQFWTKTSEGENIVKVKASPEMSPNVYAHVTLLQPHAQTTNDLPIRLYGIAPLKILDPNTIIEPEIFMPDELAPGKEVVIKISEKNKRPMAYTIAVVDEGLLDITNFKTPDAWNHFYSREAIGVKTWDVYDEVIGSHGGRFERLLAIGGGADVEQEDKKKFDERFKPVIRFMGPFFSSGKSTSHTFIMPQYIGSVKTMVVAGMDGAYGKADKTTPVIKPLMVLGTLPRVTGPGEKISLPVNVFRYDDKIKNAVVAIETEGLLSINGSKSATVDLSSSENVVKYFNLKVAKTTGSGKVTITANSGLETATHEITLESRSPNAPQTQVKLFTLEKGKEYEEALNIFGMKGTNTASLEIATVPSMNLEKRLQYLIRYPHGCIEQTVSSVFPQLYLNDITELTTDQKIKTEENIKAAIERLKKFQTVEGGLSYWPGNSSASSWGTNYGYHFLIEAEKKGYFVPKEMMFKIRRAQEQKAKYWNKGQDFNGDDITQGYRLFTLALGGNAALGSMNRMQNIPDLSAQAQWKLGVSYSLIGRDKVANELLAKAGTTPSNYPYWYSYGSSLRDKAILLETYAYLDKKELGFRILKELAVSLSKDNWYSTQTTAYCLLAISKYLGKTTASELKAIVNYAGKSEVWESKLPILRSSLNAEADSKTLSITNTGDGTLFVTITTEGTPYPGQEPATNSGLNMSVHYYNQQGESIGANDIKQGQTFEASIHISNQTPDRVRDLALSQIFPSGWEINNDRLNDTNSFSNSPFDYQDIRDDRIYTYFDLNRGEAKTFKTNLTATYSGEFYLPGAYVEAMYDANINSKGEGRWISVE